MLSFELLMLFLERLVLLSQNVIVEFLTFHLVLILHFLLHSLAVLEFKFNFDFLLHLP